MPKGAKKRAKLKKKQQGGHPAGSDGGASNNNHEGSNNSSHGDAANDGNHLPIQLNIPPGTFGIQPSSPFPIFKPGQICATPLSWRQESPFALAARVALPCRPLASATPPPRSHRPLYELVAFFRLASFRAL
jgi:hypothetical protein